MPGYNFEVERENKHRRNDSGRGIRLFVLFCVVAAVTAVVIWAILPKKEAGKEVTDGGETVGEQVVNGAETKGEADPGDAEKDPVKDSGSGSDGEKTVSGAEKGAVSPEQGQKDAAEIKKDGGQTGSVKEDNRNGEERKADKKDAEQGKVQGGDAKFDPSLQELFNHTRALNQGLTSGAWKNAKYAVVHVVAPGDTLAGMARKYRNTTAFIQHYNNIKDPKYIQINQKIALLKAEGWQVTVSRKQGTLKIDRIVNKQAVPFAVFNCQVSGRGVKRQDLVICSRVKDPGFINEQGGKFEANSKGNPYGEFLISVAAAAKPKSAILPLSIHGCGDPAEVAKSVRNGAVVLNAEDIALFYMLVPEGSPVRIID